MNLSKLASAHYNSALMLRLRTARFPYLHLAAYLFYLAAALVITWPLVTELSSRLIGHPFGDTYEYIHFVWWIKHALQTGQPVFSQPLLLYPSGITNPPGLDLSLIWAMPLQSFPGWLLAFVLPLTPAYNLAALLQFALNGWAMYRLADHLTGKARGPALIAGLIFQAFPTFQAQLAAGHTGLLTLWPIPLYLYVLLRLQSSPRALLHPMERGEKVPALTQWRGDLGVRIYGCWFILAAVLFVVSMWGNVQLLIFALLPVTAFIFLRLLMARDWAALKRTFAAVILGGALSLIFVIPAIRNAPNTPSYIEVGGSVTFSADLLGTVSPSYMNPLFAGLDYPHRVLGQEPFETTAYIGILPALLALVGIWKSRAARGWLLLGLVAWILSLGPLLKLYAAPVMTQYDGYPTFIALPWAALRNLPALNIVRTPGRFNFTVALALAVMAGYGSSQLSAVSGQRKRRVKQAHVEDLVTPSSSSPGAKAAWLRETKPTKGARTAHRWFKQPLRWACQLGSRTALASGGGRPFIFAFIAMLILLEYQFWWLTPPVPGTIPPPQFPTIPGVIPQPLIEMAGQADIRAVFDIPWSHPLVDKEALYLQTGHQHPILGGHVTRQTLLDPAEGTILQATLDPALLDAAGVDVVILHRLWDDRAGSMEKFARQQLGRLIFQDEDYAIFTAPDPSGPPIFQAVVSPLAETGSHADSYFYLPQAGQVTFSADLDADGRHVSLLLDGAVIQSWTVSGDLAINVPLAINQAGYHTASLIVEPPCIENETLALECRVLTLSHLSLESAAPGAQNQ
jgi:hypothetical protein